MACCTVPLKVTAQSEALREKTAFGHDEQNMKGAAEEKEQEELVVPSKTTTIGRSIDLDEDTEHESILPTSTHTSNRRPSSFEPYKAPSFLLCTEAVGSEAENMHLPIPNFSLPITTSNSPPPQLPTPDLSPPYPPPAHFSDPANPNPAYLQHPLHRSGKTFSANLETGLHSTCASKPSKPYIAHFPPPPTTAFPTLSPPQSHLNFSPPKPKRRTNWELEEQFPVTPSQRMKRTHRKRLYGALFAIFFVSTLGAGVGFLIHGVGDGKRASASDTERASPEVPSVGRPNGPGSLVGASEGKKEHIMWMVITGGILLGFHAVFGGVIFLLYGPCGMRKKKFVRDGRGGAVEVPRRGGP